MADLFETTAIKGLTLTNRFVRSATWEGMAREDGGCTPRLIALMVELAKGGVGLIIPGHASVLKEGQAGPWQLAVHDDALKPGLQGMTAVVHDAGGKIVLQLAHAGGRALPGLTGMEALGPSAREGAEGSSCREMTREDIQRTVKAFARAAVRARESGFDGVQIHAAHGYLLSQFLSPYYNRRSDEYGGSVAGRARIVLEVLKAVRREVGETYPILIKMNSEDFLGGGLETEEMVAVAVLLEEAGIDAVELSGGTGDSGRFIPVRPGKIDSEDKEVYYRKAAGLYREKVGAPLMLVGGIRSYAVAEELVRSGVTDYVSLSRPLIREPDLVERWKSGDRRKSTCLSDNLCFKPVRGGEGLYCYSERNSTAS